MAKVELHLDYSEIGRVLRSPEAAALVANAAEVVAGNIKGSADVYVDHYETDRAAASVTLADSRALDRELLTGQLAEAARSAGLEVHAQ